MSRGRSCQGMAENLSARIDTRLSPAAPHVHWALRLGLAAIFVYHGLDKLRAGTPPQGMLDMMFFGSGAVFWMVAVAELLAGIAIVAGAFTTPLLTRAAGAAIALIMLTAAVTVHLPAWHFMQGGAEFQVLTAALGLFFLVCGNA